MSDYYDVSSIEVEVDRLLDSGEGEKARNLFKQTIMDWSDDYTENLSETPETEDARRAIAAMSKLWIAYANLEVKLKRFDAAAEVYKSAISDPLVNGSLIIYLAYAELSRTRGNIKREKSVYFEGLCCGSMAQEDIDSLWIKLLEYTSFIATKAGGSPRIELEDLLAEVKKQADLPGILRHPSPEAYSKAALIAGADADVVKKVDLKENLAGEGVGTDEPDSHAPSPVYNDIDDVNEGGSMYSFAESKLGDDIVRATSLNIKADFEGLSDTTGMTPDSMIKLYYKSPPMLFNTSIISSGTKALDSAELEELHSFFGFPLDDIKSGAVSVLPATELVLDVIEGLYMHQALEERRLLSWEVELERQYDELNEEKQNELEEFSIGKSNTEFMKAELLYRKFQDSCCVKKEVLSAIINKTLLSILIQQYKVLFSLRFPYFTRPIFSKFESFLANEKNNKTINLFDSDPDLEKHLLFLQRVVSSLASVVLNRSAGKSSVRLVETEESGHHDKRGRTDQYSSASSYSSYNSSNSSNSSSSSSNSSYSSNSSNSSKSMATSNPNPKPKVPGFGIFMSK